MTNSAGLPPSRSAGHRYGLTQPTQVLALTIKLPPAPAGASRRVDDWLRDALGMPLPPDTKPVVATGARLPADAADAAWRMLLLAGEFLRLLQVPSFDPGCLLALRTEPAHPGAWQLRAAVPVVDGVPRTAYESAYAQAARIVAWMRRAPLTRSNLEALWERIERTVIAPNQVALPGGLSTIPILEAAHRRRIPFRHLGGGVFRLGWGRNSRLVRRSSVDLDSAIGASLAQDKTRTAGLLRAAGLPAPVHVAVGSEAQALEAARALGWPVVVKPVDRDRGEGVTVNVADEECLRAACREALALSPRILVERQVEGVCHRLHVAAGAVLIVSRRLPKSVKGDGQHTVADLVRAANDAELHKPPWNRLKPFPDDALAEASLRAAGLCRDSVPEEGRWAPLRPIQSLAWGGVVENYTETIHPANVELAVRAAQALGLSSAGVDVISPDIRRPWYENDAIVNEVNFAPQANPTRESRQMLDAFLDAYCRDGGRIPVEAFVGGREALEAARARQRALVAQGLPAHLCAHDRTLAPDGEPVALAGAGLSDRCESLLARGDTAALVVAVLTDEWLRNGSPFDRIDRLEVFDEPLLDAASDASDAQALRRELARLLPQAPA